MAHSLACVPAPVPTTATAPAPAHRKGASLHLAVPAQNATDHFSNVNSRRAFVYGLIGLSTSFCVDKAAAAARRPPPPPPQEKKDPNVSGVQAKVLASIKRKEAMKEAMRIQREKGKKLE